MKRLAFVVVMVLALVVGVVSRAKARTCRDAYCGCPEKAKCAFDEPKDCGGCCAPEKCTGNPTR